MTRLLISAALGLTVLASCGSSVLRAPIDFDDYPPEMPQRLVTDLSSDAQKNLSNALNAADRELSGVCSPQEMAQIKEALIIFGWITSSDKHDLYVQTYVDARAPVLREARENLNPACGEKLSAAVQRLRGTDKRPGRL